MEVVILISPSELLTDICIEKEYLLKNIDKMTFMESKKHIDSIDKMCHKFRNYFGLNAEILTWWNSERRQIEESIYNTRVWLI